MPDGGWQLAIPDDEIRLTKLRQVFVGPLKTTVAAKEQPRSWVVR